MKVGRSFVNYLKFFKHIVVAFRVFEEPMMKMFDIRKISEIASAYFDYGWDPKEYFQFNFSTLSEDAKQSYICAREHIAMTCFLNTKEEALFLRNKWKTYQRYGDFFDRKVLHVTNDNLAEWTDFLKSQEKLIVKPWDGSFGQGIKIINCKEYLSNPSKIISEYPSGCVAEELVVQNEEMASLHPESVNTIRIYTLNYNNDISIFHPWLRIGRGKNVIDNASAGGIGAALDFKDGTIVHAGDKMGHTFSVHPDNGNKLIGFQIPKWDELMSVVRKLAEVNPSLHYAGWDLALSKNGWVLIEGNPQAQIGFQIFERRGFRTDLDEYLTRYNLIEEYYSKLNK